MYKKMVPYKDYNDKPQNEYIHLLLETRDVFKVVVELKALLDWMESMQGAAPRELSYEEMRDFFNNFEAVILEAYGKPSADGKIFDRSERYEFEQSKLFSAFMDMLLSDVSEAGNMLAEIMPKNMTEILENQRASIDKLAEETGNDPETVRLLQQRIAELESNRGTEQPPAQN